MRRWLAALAVLALVAFYFVIPIARVWQTTRIPALFAGPVGPPPPGSRAVEFPTTDGLVLRGWLRPGRLTAGVVLAHGWTQDRTALRRQSDLLADAGFNVLAFDLRAHGESDGKVSTRGWREPDDVLAAVSFLQRQPGVEPGRIGAFGFSIGGQSVLRATARSQAIRAVVADGPVAGSLKDEPRPATLGDWANYPARGVFYALLPLAAGMDTPPPLMEEVAAIAPRPALLIAGGGYEARQERRLASAGSSVTLWVIPEAGHGGGIRLRPDEYRTRLVEFYEAALVRPR